VPPSPPAQFIFQQLLSLAYHIAMTSSSVEELTLLSWKSSTFKLVKNLCTGRRREMGWKY